MVQLLEELLVQEDLLEDLLIEIQKIEKDQNQIYSL